MSPRVLPEGYRPGADKFFILGPIEVVADDGPLELGGPKERAALAALAAWPGQVLSPERLVEALWGDEPPRSCGKVVQNVILRLRKAVGPTTIETRNRGYVLVAPPDAVDARRFEQLAAKGRAALAHGDPSAVRNLSTALALWRSSPLPELADWPTAAVEIVRLEELHRCLVEDVAEAELAIGHHQEWVAQLETMVADQPLRERRWRLLMLALYRSGRQADALRAYQRARTALSELGLEPGADLRATEHTISTHEMSDVAPSAPGSTRPLPTGVVTFLLTDIEGSTTSWERSPGAMSAAVERHDELIERAVMAAGGVVLKARGEGDSKFSVFTKTSAAVSAALAATDALAQHTWPTGVDLAVRMAVHTGEAHERDGDYFGPTVNRAARLRGIAAGGQLVLSEPVAALVRDDLPEGWDLVELGEQALHGLARPERAFTLVRSGEVIERGATLVARSCPYLGLLPFQPEDHRVYFGRQDVLRDLVDRLDRDRFVAVVGASGSGKSSLLRAGLVAGLARGALPGSASWASVVLAPGARPLAELAAHLGPLCGDSAADLLHDLESDHRALDVAIRQALSTLPPGSRVVLVVDQLEELFTLCRDNEERRRFLDTLTDAASALDAPTLVVLAVRADFFGHFAAHEDFARLLERHALLLGPMDDAALREAIEGPARVAGLVPEPGLTDVILRDVAGEPGGLPLMSHALLEVWGRRDGRTLTIAGYRASGGVAGAIARSADAVYERLPPIDQRIARQVFVRLTELGEGTEDTRRRATLDELGHDAGEVSRTESVLATLAAARLVTVAEDTVEVAHEALIRAWPRLRTWLDEDRDGLRMMRHLTHAARDWAERGRDDTELYRGPRLAAALEWRSGGHGEDLNALEHEFLDAGQRELAARAGAQARATRRLRLLLGGTAVALVVALVAGTVAVGQRNEANDARDRADSAARAEAVRGLWARSLLARETSLDLALLLALEANRRDDSPETRGALQSALLSNPELLGFLRGGGRSYKSVSISSAGLIAAGTREGTVDVWTADDRRLMRTLEVGSGPVVVAFAPDGSLLGVLTDGDRELLVLDGSTMTAIGVPVTDDAGLVNQATFGFSPDGRHVAVALASGEIGTWDVATGREVGERMSTGDLLDPFRAVAYSRDGRLLAAGTQRGRVALYDVATRSPAGPALAGRTNSTPVSLEFDPAQRRLAAGSATGTTYLWDLATGARVDTTALGVGGGAQVAFSPDGSRLVTGGATETVELVDSDGSGEHLPPIHTHGGVVLDVAFSPDGRYVATANINGTISIVDVVGERKLGHPLPTEPLQGGVYSPDGSVLAAPDYRDGSLYLLDPDDGRVLHHLQPPGMRPIDVQGLIPGPAFSPDGRRVAYGGLTGQIAVFDVGTGDLATTLRPPPATTDHPFGVVAPDVVPTYVGPLAFSPDGTKLVSTAWETATVFDLDSGQPLATVDGWTLLATSASFTGDSRRFVVSGFQSVTLVFDADDGEQVGPPIGSADAPAFLSYVGPGDTLVTADFSGTIRRIDLTTREQIGPAMVGRAVPVSTINILPGNRELVATFYGADGEAQLFDIETGYRIGDPFPTAGLFGEAFLSPDGSALIAGDGTRMVRWDLDVDAWRTAACHIAGRNLTEAEWRQYLPDGEPYRATCPENG